MSRQVTLQDQLKALITGPALDDGDRKELLPLLRQAMWAVERPLDVAHRVAFAGLQTSVARVAMDLKLFDMIAASDDPTTLDSLVKQTGAQPLLIRRTLRFLNSYGLVDEPSPCNYVPTQGTKYMARSGIQAGVKFNHDLLLPTWQATPPFLQKTKYENITDAANTPFQEAWHTDQLPFAWASKRPTDFNNMSQWMACLYEISPSWLDMFPHPMLLNADSADASAPALFLDIGGGIGHQCAELKTRLPQLKGRVILQDLAPAIEHALPTSGVESTVYDFWGPQPVHGARFYYLKSVLHDHPDDRCVEILRNQISAMGPDSLILIDEIVLPETRPHWRAAEQDMALMSIGASTERTECQWRELLDKAGLVIREKYLYDDEMMNSVMVVALK